MCYAAFMDWLRSQWGRHKAAIFVALLVAAALAASVWYPASIKNTGAGFGPDWECTPQAQGGPTCIKKIRP
jgi:hypothetical protein